jgi:mannose-1-phosphate guanylyltransferase
LEARRRGDEESAHRIYSRLPLAAVDYTVMEKTERLLLVPAQFEWLDVGSWADLHAILKQDAAGNTLEGAGILIDTRSCLISAPGKLVAAIGVSDLVIVDTPEALLIVPKSRSQEVKKVVEALGRARKVEYL